MKAVLLIGFTGKTVTFPKSGLQTEYLKNVQPCAAAPKTEGKIN